MGWFVPLLIAGGATGMGMQMKAQHEAGKAASRAAETQAQTEAAWREYNAQLAERDAQIARELAERRAKEELEAAATEEGKLRKAGERLKAKQRARYGKAGVTFEGSPEEFMTGTASELEWDALEIRRGGQTRAQSALYGGRVEGQRYTAEAALSRYMGRSALLRGRTSRRASRYGMLGTGLTGATSLAYMGYSLK